MSFMDGYRTLGRLAIAAALIGCELWLARDLTGHSGFAGYTATKVYAVAPQVRARVKSLHVTLGAAVVANQPIAELDSVELDNELDLAIAQRQHAVAAIAAASSRLRRDTVNIERRFEASDERAAADLSAAEASAQTASAELAAVERELATQQDLVAKHLANITAVNALELRRAGLAKQVEQADEVLRVLRDNMTAAAKRQQGFGEIAAGDDLAPLQAELAAAQLKIDQLGRERAALVLRAPVDGVVDQLPLQPGELASPEVPVATIATADTLHVVACVPEARAAAIEVGDRASAISAFSHVESTGRVESVTGEIAPLPPRCQLPGAKVVAMGRVAMVALDHPIEGLPGQTQIVTIEARRGSARTRASVAAASGAPAATEGLGSGSGAALAASPSAGAPIPMRVPAALLGRSRFEPSGAVWVPALGRYVIASDDTGFKDSNNHAPWLFTMSIDGDVDPSPLAIAGIDALDDLESIAADERGDLWVASSQSVNHKGKRSPARQRLARIAVTAAGAKVTGVVELLPLLAALPAPTRAALGITDLRALDIEALAVRGGALYLGLKAPVDGTDRAMIWRIADPTKLLAGELPAAGIAVWATAQLAVEADGRIVPGGFADLTFLDDDTIAFSATASGIDPAEQSGALYVARASAGALDPHLVRTFAGLKPEGLAVAPAGGWLTIVFDRGSEAALWTQIALADVRAALPRAGARGGAH